jgi:hypothetical protein
MKRYYFVFCKDDLLLQEQPDGTCAIPLCEDPPTGVKPWTTVLTVAPLGETEVCTYGIDAPEEAAGFGDDYADIGMKEGLAHFIAMGNGREEVKAEAEFVTKRIEEGGMRAGLEYLGVI